MQAANSNDIFTNIFNRVHGADDQSSQEDFMNFIVNTFKNIFYHQQKCEHKNDYFLEELMVDDINSRRLIQGIQNNKFVFVRAGAGAGKSFLLCKALGCFNLAKYQSPVVYHVTRTRAAVASIGENFPSTGIDIRSKTLDSFIASSNKLYTENVYDFMDRVDSDSMRSMVHALNKEKIATEHEKIFIKDPRFERYDNQIHYASCLAKDAIRNKIHTTSNFDDDEPKIKDSLSHEQTSDRYILFVDEAQLLDRRSLLLVLNLALSHKCIRVFFAYDVNQTSKTLPLIEDLIVRLGAKSQYESAQETFAYKRQIMGSEPLHTAPARFFAQMQRHLFKANTIGNNTFVFDVFVTMRHHHKLYEQFKLWLGEEYITQIALKHHPIPDVAEMVNTVDQWTELINQVSVNFQSDGNKLSLSETIVFVDTTYYHILNYFNSSRLKSLFWNTTAISFNDKTYSRLVIPMSGRALRGWDAVLMICKSLHGLRQKIDSLASASDPKSIIGEIALDLNGIILMCPTVALGAESDIDDFNHNIYKVAMKMNNSATEIQSGYSSQQTLPDIVAIKGFPIDDLSYDKQMSLKGIDELLILFNDVFIKQFYPYIKKSAEVKNSLATFDYMSRFTVNDTFEESEEVLASLLRLQGRLMSTDFISGFLLYNLYSFYKHLFATQTLVLDEESPAKRMFEKFISEHIEASIKGHNNTLFGYDVDHLSYYPDRQYVAVAQLVPQTLHGATFKTVVVNSDHIHAGTSSDDNTTFNLVITRATDHVVFTNSPDANEDRNHESFGDNHRGRILYSLSQELYPKLLSRDTNTKEISTMLNFIVLFRHVLAQDFFISPNAITTKYSNDAKAYYKTSSRFLKTNKVSSYVRRNPDIQQYPFITHYRVMRDNGIYEKNTDSAIQNALKVYMDLTFFTKNLNKNKRLQVKSFNETNQEIIVTMPDKFTAEPISTNAAAVLPVEFTYPDNEDMQVNEIIKSILTKTISKALGETTPMFVSLHDYNTKIRTYIEAVANSDDEKDRIKKEWLRACIEFGEIDGEYSESDTVPLDTVYEDDEE